MRRRILFLVLVLGSILNVAFAFNVQKDQNGSIVLTGVKDGDTFTVINESNDLLAYYFSSGVRRLAQYLRSNLNQREFSHQLKNKYRSDQEIEVMNVNGLNFFDGVYPNEKKTYELTAGDFVIHFQGDISNISFLDNRFYPEYDQNITEGDYRDEVYFSIGRQEGTVLDIDVRRLTSQNTGHMGTAGTRRLPDL